MISRRSLLAMLGLAPAAAVLKPLVDEPNVHGSIKAVHGDLGTRTGGIVDRCKMVFEETPCDFSVGPTIADCASRYDPRTIHISHSPVITVEEAWADGRPVHTNCRCTPFPQSGDSCERP